MPGMGLTAIGLAGVTLSYAGIAHTFIDGMHALTGLTMFVGLIFLAAGILDGGISTSNRAKATTLVVLSIALGFGMFALGTMNTSNFTVTLAGILMGIAFPAILIAYLAMKHSNLVKPIGSIVAMSAATGIIAWLAFGVVSPDAYMIPQVIDEEIKEEMVTNPIFAIEILKDSTIEGNPDYKPDITMVPKGHTIEWTNSDNIVHTVTSTQGFGEIFDSSLIESGDVFRLDTTNLDSGKYEYLCSLHAWMTATIIIEEPKESIKITIPQGAAILKDGQIYYKPDVIDVAVGTTITWDNIDNTVHTVTSQEGTTEIFDSSIISPGDMYEFTFDTTGSHDYFCTFHTWMTGTVNVVE